MLHSWVLANGQLTSMSVSEQLFHTYTPHTFVVHLLSPHSWTDIIATLASLIHLLSSALSVYFCLSESLRLHILCHFWVYNIANEAGLYCVCSSIVLCWGTFHHTFIAIHCIFSTHFLAVYLSSSLPPPSLSLSLFLPFTHTPSQYFFFNSLSLSPSNPFTLFSSNPSPSLFHWLCQSHSLSVNRSDLPTNRLRPSVLQNLPIILFCSAYFNYPIFPVLLNFTRIRCV